jgi:hypothetical protein
MMTTKPKKTNAELTSLIMGEIRKHPECDNITGVGIIRPVQAAPHHPNWAPAWSVSGSSLAPPIADDIARTFQNRFDLL